MYVTAGPWFEEFDGGIRSVHTLFGGMYDFRLEAFQLSKPGFYEQFSSLQKSNDSYDKFTSPISKVMSYWHFLVPSEH